MKKTGNGLGYFVLTVILVMAAVAYFFGWNIDAKLHPETAAESIEELSRMIDEQIDSGEQSGDFYVKNISKDEIDNINEYICCLNGSVYKYSILEKPSSDIMKVRMIYNLSDNYYVYKMYRCNESPEDTPETAKELYEKVVEILESLISPGMSDYEKELAIHDYIVKNCEYGYPDSNKENAYTTYGALIDKKAVCNGYAEAMALLLTCVDIENDIMTGTADGELHAWNRVCLDGNWYQLDATWDDPIPDRGDFAGHMYFNVTDDVMDDTHTWTEGDFEKCTSWNYNYFYYNNLICNSVGFSTAVTNLAYRDMYGTMEIVLTDYSDSYDMSFLASVSGIESVAYSEDTYGDYELLTIYLNQKE
jgi:hypothetical protein